ncbi:MAG: hypothetical protein JW737_03415 [Acidobacteria bacterium]|nr:hypothetical protein [Acidobacteriota bacterium]
MEYQSKNPNVQVAGGAVLAFVNSLTNKELGLKYLAAHGITEIQSDKLYSQQAYLDALKDLVKAIGVPGALEGVGEKIPDYLPPMNVKDVFELFETWINHYRAANPGDNESYIRVTDKGENYLYIETNNPVACAFDRGLIRAFARKFHPNAKVTSNGDMCRAKGDAACLYHVFW